MSLNDPISNMLTSIRNASNVKKDSVDVPASKISKKILEIFRNDGYIEDFRTLSNTKQGTLKVYLKYKTNNEPVIIGLKRVSRPGLRKYVKHDEIPRVLNGLGSAVISTSRGVMSDRQARKEKIGGEILCYVW